MWSYVLKRVMATLVTLFFASIIIFGFIHVIPGDPIYVMLGDMATPEQAEVLRHSLGLDQPILLQYVQWAGKALTGDLGRSIFYQAPVMSAIADGAETSILLASITMIWVILIGVPIGMIAAMRHGSLLDQGLSGAAMLLASPALAQKGQACDVGDARQVQALVDAAVTAFGRLDLCVSNAGIIHGGLRPRCSR